MLASTLPTATSTDGADETAGIESLGKREEEAYQWEGGRRSKSTPDWRIPYPCHRRRVPFACGFQAGIFSTSKGQGVVTGLERRGMSRIQATSGLTEGSFSCGQDLFPDRRDPQGLVTIPGREWPKRTWPQWAPREEWRRRRRWRLPSARISRPWPRHPVAAACPGAALAKQRDRSARGR